jgi:hypothetical protein
MAARSSEEWSFAADIQRYEGLLKHAHKFKVGDHWPIDPDQTRQQIERIQAILDQLKAAIGK